MSTNTGCGKAGFWRREGGEMKVNLVADDEIGVLRSVLSVCAELEMNVVELQAHRASAPDGGVPLFYAEIYLEGERPATEVQMGLEDLSDELMAEIMVEEEWGD